MDQVLDVRGVGGATQGEAYLLGLESAIQFLLEDVNVEWECMCISLVSNPKDIVEWIRGSEETSWESRFLRNKTKEKEFIKAKLQWEERAKANVGIW
ncbi:hypothetical protein PIB30_050512 [Stylosanthes scabra]|uniref:RNase H type-1 domain-containing protein n=1 Tax=Stylosanthes scabra TaxID=79078 RepID=A0ABU6SI44_9FABA|nr:hypothetical protein [Stylosanthes scabra]